ncbi:carboxylate--amine ligase [Aquipuribacter sp. SD81]|uniref:carboxylate--amine ligase n=1 Tax=Aquipuribacter sp. SD81 TaxID=3127703 RepID=UPI00301676CE
MDGAPAALRPVVLGGDIGAYSLARHFHENHGVRPVVVSGAASGLMSRSAALQHVREPALEDPDTLVAVLHRLVEPDAATIVLASADRLVARLVEVRDRLPETVVVPYVEAPLLRRMTDKAEFSRVCAELGVAHPRTVVADLSLLPGTSTPSDVDPAVDTSGLVFPVFAKAASTVAYAGVSFEGKRKGFVVADRAQLLDLLARVRRAGYTSGFLVQELVAGDDSGMRILTCYSDRSGRVRYSSFGHVLLEEHAPSAIGNPAAILTDHDPDVVADATRLLEHVGWTGWANFDLKVDPRTGRTVFFELNPRLGRSNFYVAAGQTDPVAPYVREYVRGLDPYPPGSPEHAEPGHLFTVLPRPLLLRYLDEDLRARVRAAYRAGHVHNPLWYSAERDPRRLAYLAASHANQYRKFARHYPVGEARARQLQPAGRTA